MASTITHTQTRSIVANQYRVVDTATASANIPLEPFVFQTSNATYSRIATVDDMENLLNTQLAAQGAGDEYYRLATVTKDWVLLSDAVDFAATIKDRLKQLVVDYDAAVNNFIGTESTTVSS